MGRHQDTPGSERESPRVNGRVRLVYDAERRAADVGGDRVALSTRVEDVRDSAGRYARFVISAPVDSGEAPRPGDQVVCMMEWTSERGLWAVPTRYAGLERGPHDTRFWLLDQIGGPVRSQRRQYVRVEWAVPLAVVVRPAEEHGAAGPGQADGSDGVVVPLLGRTRDISEGGVACFLDAPPLAAGTGVRVVLGVADDPVEADGVVLSGGASDTEGWSLVFITFADPATVGDLLRPLLFEEQRRVRRLAMA